jgi:hypothetical protein
VGRTRRREWTLGYCTVYCTVFHLSVRGRGCGEIVDPLLLDTMVFRISEGGLLGVHVRSVPTGLLCLVSSCWLESSIELMIIGRYNLASPAVM